MTNPCIVNFSAMATMFTSGKQTSAGGLNKMGNLNCNLAWLITWASNTYFFIHRHFFLPSRWYLLFVLAAHYYSMKEYKNSSWLSILLKLTLCRQSMKYLLNLCKQSQHQINATNKGNCYFYVNMISKKEYTLQIN